VRIAFRTRKLQRQYEHSAEAVRAYGDQVARKYVERINIIKAARDVNELQQTAVLRCHPLTGDRAGQWAVRLTGFCHLIVTLDGEDLEIAMIEEVSKHYDD
jgi:proteic killer suppression protein